MVVWPKIIWPKSTIDRKFIWPKVHVTERVIWTKMSFDRKSFYRKSNGVFHAKQRKKFNQLMLQNSNWRRRKCYYNQISSTSPNFAWRRRWSNYYNQTSLSFVLHVICRYSIEMTISVKWHFRSNEIFGQMTLSVKWHLGQMTFLVKWPFWSSELPVKCTFHFAQTTRADDYCFAGQFSSVDFFAHVSWKNLLKSNRKLCHLAYLTVLTVFLHIQYQI
jgi:hypothetical protein